jgi:hypothetical protein
MPFEDAPPMKAPLILVLTLALAGCGTAAMPTAAGRAPGSLAAASKADEAALEVKLLDALVDRSLKGKGYTWSVLPVDPEFLGDVEVTFKPEGKLLRFTVEGLQVTDNDQQGGTARGSGLMDAASGKLSQVKLTLVSIDF